MSSSVSTAAFTGGRSITGQRSIPESDRSLPAHITNPTQAPQLFSLPSSSTSSNRSPTPRQRIQMMNEHLTNGKEYKNHEFWSNFAACHFSGESMLPLRLKFSLLMGSALELVSSPLTPSANYPPPPSVFPQDSDAQMITHGKDIDPVPVKSLRSKSCLDVPKALLPRFFLNWTGGCGMCKMQFILEQAIELALPAGFSIINNAVAVVETLILEGAILIRQHGRISLVLDPLGRIFSLELTILHHHEFLLANRAINLLQVNGQNQSGHICPWGFPMAVHRMLDMMSVLLEMQPVTSPIYSIPPLLPPPPPPPTSHYQSNGYQHPSGIPFRNGNIEMDGDSILAPLPTSASNLAPFSLPISFANGANCPSPIPMPSLAGANSTADFVRLFNALRIPLSNTNPMISADRQNLSSSSSCSSSPARKRRSRHRKPISTQREDPPPLEDTAPN